LEISIFFNSQKFCKNGNKFGSKKPVFEVKTGGLGSKTGVSEHSKFKEYSEFVLFRTFQKLQKNDVKIKL